LGRQGYDNLVLRSSAELDLRNQTAVAAFFDNERPMYVILAAAKVGGILANSTYPADFIRDNLRIQTNVIESARESGVRKLCFLGSSCIYPKLAPQPIRRIRCLPAHWSRPTSGTQLPRSLASTRSLASRCARRIDASTGFNAISLMPTNMYGPGDNFDLQNSHVLPALIPRFHEAKLRGDTEVVVWGTGTPRREFLYVDDLAKAIVHLMRVYEGEELVNIGCGADVTIQELAEMVADVVGVLRPDRLRRHQARRYATQVARYRVANSLGRHATVSLRDGIAVT
jgi:GDP-L-fucose synthase